MSKSRLHAVRKKERVPLFSPLHHRLSAFLGEFSSLVPPSLRRPFRRRTLKKLSRVVQVVSPPSALQARSCPRSGFHAFQCRFLPPPSHSNPRSGIRDILVASLLPPPSRSPSLPLCSLCPLWLKSLPLSSLTPPAGRISSPRKFFPIVGKRAKNFSNHWKNQPIFSNHWKNIFQSLENCRFSDELPDWPKPGGLMG